MKVVFISFMVLTLALMYGATSSTDSENRIAGFYEDSVKAYLTGLPQLDLPFGDKEAIFYEYPPDWETDLVGDAWNDKDSTTSKYFKRAYYAYEKLDRDSFFVYKTRRFYVIMAFVYQLNSGGNRCVLYTLNNKCETIDSLLLEGQGFIRSSHMHNAYCYIDHNKIIHIKDFYIPSPVEKVEYMGYRAYKISANGVFVSYFERKNGAVENVYKHHADNWFVFQEKGEVKNHLKQGTWTEVKTNFDLKPGQDDLQFKTTHVVATYHEGLPVGIWDFYKVDMIADDTSYMVYPVKSDLLLMRAVYDEGKLISKEIFHDALKRDEH